MPFHYPSSVRRGLSERMRQGEAVLAVVESGSVRDVFHNSKKGYTRRLIESIPGRQGS